MRRARDFFPRTVLRLTKDALRSFGAAFLDLEDVTFFLDVVRDAFLTDAFRELEDAEVVFFAGAFLVVAAKDANEPRASAKIAAKTREHGGKNVMSCFQIPVKLYIPNPRL